MKTKTYIVPEITTIKVDGTTILAGSSHTELSKDGSQVTNSSTDKKDPWGGAMAPERVHYDWSDDEEE